jgi:hypothetical protein
VELAIVTGTAGTKFAVTVSGPVICTVVLELLAEATGPLHPVKT